MERLEKGPAYAGGSFRNAVVGFDDHQGGRDATALARQLLASDGSMTLARVYIREARMGRGASPEFEAAEHLQAQEQRAAAKDEGQVDGELRRVDSSSVGRGLHVLADIERADLLVVGSCRRGLVGRVMVGDETSDALNGAPCAVAVAPFGYADRPTVLGEIGVAYNGSPESEAALAVARALASEHKSRLSAFEAVAVPAYLSVPGAGAAIESLPALVEQASARITALGGVEAHAAYGQAAEELAVFSASLNLLVVGSRGYGPFGRLVHGSTSRQLVRTARCPLLVLTRGAGVRSPQLAERPAAAAAVG